MFQYILESVSGRECRSNEKADILIKIAKELRCGARVIDRFNNIVLYQNEFWTGEKFEPLIKRI